MSENLGSKEIRLGSQVRKQEQANILKWAFHLLCLKYPPGIQSESNRCLIPILDAFLNANIFKMGKRAMLSKHTV